MFKIKLYFTIKFLNLFNMKTLFKRSLVAFAILATLLYGCTKSFNDDNLVKPQDGNAKITPHVYGVLPTTPDMVIGVTLYSSESIPLAKKAEALPANFTLATPAIRDQGQIGSCTAFCGAETDEILYYYKNGTWTSVLSPAFVYYCERVLILKQKITADAGASMINVPQALQKYGDCLESYYAYPSSNKSTAYKTAPTSTALSNGLNYRIGQTGTSYALVATGDVNAVKTLLNDHKPVMMGFNVYDNTAYTLFEGLNSTSYTYNPLTKSGALVTGAKLLGGHAVPIIGYDDTQAGGAGAFYVMNSWGTSWGKAGFFWLPYSVFKSTKIVPANNCYYAKLE
jgi:C1A family cysteine protease